MTCRFVKSQVVADAVKRFKVIRSEVDSRRDRDWTQYFAFVSEVGSERITVGKEARKEV